MSQNANFFSKLILEVLLIILVAVHDFESEVMKGIYETLEVTYFSQVFIFKKQEKEIL